MSRNVELFWPRDPARIMTYDRRADLQQSAAHPAVRTKHGSEEPSNVENTERNQEFLICN